VKRNAARVMERIARRERTRRVREAARPKIRQLQGLKRNNLLYSIAGESEYMFFSAAFYRAANIGEVERDKIDAETIAAIADGEFKFDFVAVVGRECAVAIVKLADIAAFKQKIHIGKLRIRQSCTIDRIIADFPKSVELIYSALFVFGARRKAENSEK
jgi:hypothetical protein